MMLAHISTELTARRAAVDAWFAEKARTIASPLFLSCDLRHSGNKIAVVDANLFPAGFNNLCASYSRQAAQAMAEVFRERFPEVRRILLLAESHTRNKFYFENLWHLQSLFEAAKIDVRIAMSEPDFHDPLQVTLDEGRPLTVYPIFEAQVRRHRIEWNDFVPDLVVSNNDFSRSLPVYWQGLAQPIVPPPQLGWQHRRKSRHFALVRQLTDEFAALIGVDPWRLQCRFDVAQNIDLTETSHLERLAAQTDALLGDIRRDYERHGITETPYLFLKSDSGTYGMGITTVYAADELRQLNRKERNKILSSKSGMPNANFILQEGIPTSDFYSEQPVEPVIYLIGGRFAGGFFRINPLRDAYESLNSQGMQFSCLCLHKLDKPHEIPFIQCACKKELVGVSTVLARISALAAGLEAAEIQ